MRRRDGTIERGWQALLKDATPAEILRWAGATFGDDLTLACSFGGVSGMVLLDLTRKLLPDVSVFTLDTGYLFPETHALRELAAERYKFTPLVMTPAENATPGPRLPSLDACCAARKVEPTGRALAGKSAWIAGLRRDQSKMREEVLPMAWDPEFSLYKIAPLWAWTEDDCWAYVNENKVPVNALHAQGYPSIGCTHCTRAVAPGEDLRAGRWSDEEKTECGLHLPRSAPLSPPPSRWVPGAGGGGLVVWLTGLSGAGKSTLARALAAVLKEKFGRCEVLDGDEVREFLSKGLGFSREDRDTNVLRIAYVASLLARNDVPVIVAAISPYADTRESARQQIGPERFVEVYADCTLDELTRRDVKGLYKKAALGQLSGLTGISDPYEPPQNPDVSVNSATMSLEQSLELILSTLKNRKFME